MRKYKVWDKSNKRWATNVVLIQEGILLWQFGNTLSDINSQGDYIVCFSTGLKDRKGKEIYEGDYVRVYAKETKGKVQIEEVQWIEDKESIENNHWALSKSEGWSSKELEVVGNKHQDPLKCEKS